MQNGRSNAVRKLNCSWADQHQVKWVMNWQQGMKNNLAWDLSSYTGWNTCPRHAFSIFAVHALSIASAQMCLSFLTFLNSKLAERLTSWLYSLPEHFEWLNHLFAQCSSKCAQSSSCFCSDFCATSGVSDPSDSIKSVPSCAKTSSCLPEESDNSPFSKMLPAFSASLNSLSSTWRDPPNLKIRLFNSCISSSNKISLKYLSTLLNLVHICILTLNTVVYPANFHGRLPDFDHNASTKANWSWIKTTPTKLGSSLALLHTILAFSWRVNPTRRRPVQKQFTGGLESAGRSPMLWMLAPLHRARSTQGLYASRSAAWALLWVGYCTGQSSLPQLLSHCHTKSRTRAIPVGRMHMWAGAIQAFQYLNCHWASLNHAKPADLYF